MSQRRGSFLIESGIVVLLLLALAAVVVPQYFMAGSEARTNMLRTDLRIIREAIQEYQTDHDGMPPGLGPDGFRESTFLRQLSRPTRIDGTVDPGGEHGPYLPAGIPENPFNGRSDVRILIEEAADVEFDSTTGWIYHPARGEFYANSEEAEDE